MHCYCSGATPVLHWFSTALLLHAYYTSTRRMKSWCYHWYCICAVMFLCGSRTTSSGGCWGPTLPTIRCSMTLPGQIYFRRLGWAGCGRNRANLRLLPGQNRSILGQLLERMGKLWPESGRCWASCDRVRPSSGRNRQSMPRFARIRKDLDRMRPHSQSRPIWVEPGEFRPQLAPLKHRFPERRFGNFEAGRDRRQSLSGARGEQLCGNRRVGWLSFCLHRCLNRNRGGDADAEAKHRPPKGGEQSVERAAPWRGKGGKDRKSKK